MLSLRGAKQRGNLGLNWGKEQIQRQGCHGLRPRNDRLLKHNKIKNRINQRFLNKAQIAEEACLFFGLKTWIANRTSSSLLLWTPGLKRSEAAIFTQAESFNGCVKIAASPSAHWLNTRNSAMNRHCFWFLNLMADASLNSYLTR